MAQRRPRDAETPEMQTLAERNIARDYAVQYNGPVIRTVNIYRLDQGKSDDSKKWPSHVMLTSRYPRRVSLHAGFEATEPRGHQVAH